MARILVIDDNAVNREFACQIIRGMGHTADSVPDGPTAVERVKATKYDLIFLDIRMPGMDGFEVARYIRAVENPSVRTPMVAVTAYGGVDYHESCRLAGINGFISKPLTLEKMNSIFTRWLWKKSRRIQKLIFKRKKFRFGLGQEPI